MVVGVVEVAVAVVVVIMVALDWIALILVVEASVVDMVVAGANLIKRILWNQNWSTLELITFVTIIAN